MNESLKSVEVLRHELVVKMVQNPVFFLEKNITKGCKASIIFLMKLRHEVQKDTSYKIPNPDTLFKTFYEANTGDAVYYEMLVTMLKNAGYSKDSINEGFFDWLQEEVKGNKDIRVHAQEISSFCQTAVVSVFKNTTQ